MTWLIYCAIVSLILSFGSVALMNSIMEGIGKTQTMMDALHNPHSGYCWGYVSLYGLLSAADCIGSGG